MTTPTIYIERVEFPRRPTVWFVSRQDVPQYDRQRRCFTGVGCELLEGFFSEAEAEAYVERMRALLAD